MREIGGMPGSIEAIGLHKSYGRVRALRGLSLRVEGGEIYGLLGPNGAGKTTTLKILVGLLKPDKGTAKICGYDIVRERTKALRFVGYIPENPVCFQNLTAREFLELVGALRGLSRDEVEEAVDRYFSIFDLQEKEGELVGRLSRGMVQKLLASAAFMVRPRALIMDEPIVGMDPEAQHAFKEEVKRLAASGTAVLISSHLLDMVERFCTKVGVISEGVLVAEGDLEELRRKAESGEDTPLEEVFLKLLGGA